MSKADTIMWFMLVNDMYNKIRVKYDTITTKEDVKKLICELEELNVHLTKMLEPYEYILKLRETQINVFNDLDSLKKLNA